MGMVQTSFAAGILTRRGSWEEAKKAMRTTMKNSIKLSANVWSVALLCLMLASTLSSAQTGQGRITGYVHDQ